MRVSYSYAVRDQNRLVYQRDEDFIASLPSELRGPMQRWFERFQLTLDDDTTVKFSGSVLLLCSKTDVSSYSSMGRWLGRPLASLQAHSHLRHPTHKLRSVSIPIQSSETLPAEAACVLVGPTTLATPAAPAILRNCRRFVLVGKQPAGFIA